MTTKPAPKSRPKAAKPAKKAKATRKRPSPSPISPDDAHALDQFCSNLVFEEIPFDSWQQTLDNLDLTVPLWLPAEGALLGGEVAVKFCRSVRDTAAAPPRREPSSCLVAVPPKSKTGDRVVVPANGDKIADRSGDLIVILNLKPEN